MNKPYDNYEVINNKKRMYTLYVDSRKEIDEFLMICMGTFKKISNGIYESICTSGMGDKGIILKKINKE